MSESKLILITPIPNGEPTYRLKRKRKIMTDTKDLSSTDLLQYIRRNSYIEEHVIDDFEVVTKSIEKAKTHLASAMKCPTNAGKLVECNRALMAMPPSEHFGSPGTASATLFASVLALRGEALASLRYHAAATKSFREALKHTPEENHIKRFKLIRDLLRIGEASDTETTEVLRSEARSMLEKAGFSDIQIGNQMNSLSADRGKEQDEKIPMLEVDSPPHEYLSDAVMFTRNDKVGTHVIAKRDIQIEEVILAERPALSILFLEAFATNCQNCFRNLLEIFPCPTCRLAAFCTQQCLDEAKFHTAYECGFQHLYGAVGPMALGIRFCTTRCVKDFESGIVEASRVLQLQRAQHGPEYTVDIAIKTHYITYCLDRMGYFRGAEPQSKTKLRESLSNFLRVVDENSHEIVHFNGVPPKTVGRFSSLEPSDYVEHLGACVNLNNTLFNNSCDVNTYKYHVGNRTVMVAKKSIKAGEEITDFYGQHFFLSTTEERQSRLGFECQCSPCLQNWGTYPILSTAGLEEEKESKLLKMQDSLTIASQSMDVEKIKAASLEICLFLATLPRPQKALIIPEMNVNICSGLMHGNKSVQFIERLFNISGQKK